MRAFLAGLMLAATAMTAHGEDFQAGQITVNHPWARATAPAAQAGAAYFVLTSEAAAPDLLVSASTPMADRAELHTHRMDGGIMRMMPVEAIEVAPGAPTVLEPGGLHVMLMGLHGPLTEGETFPLTLVFEAAGEVTVDVTVQGVAATAPEEAGHDHGGSHMN